MLRKVHVCRITCIAHLSHYQDYYSTERVVMYVAICETHLKMMREFMNSYASLQEQAPGEHSNAVAAQLQRAEGKLRAHLERHMSSDHFTTYEALVVECGEVEQRGADLSRALEVSLAERMLQLLAQQMGALHQAASEGAQLQAERDSEVRSCSPMSLRHDALVSDHIPSTQYAHYRHGTC